MRLINRAIFTIRLFFSDKSARLTREPNQNQAEWKINCISRKVIAIVGIVSVDTPWLWKAVNDSVIIIHAFGFNG